MEVVDLLLQRRYAGRALDRNRKPGVNIRSFQSHNPYVYDAYDIDKSLDRGVQVVVMEYIEGDILRDVWDDMATRSEE
ncbi:hypothetical protein ACJ72_07824 [Emergomyces africanus]|uniref:Protein kinase domain-containing protein n=1 Tax=Emergomyces africanus TaxID=1955775 RepID=A0A1B7NM11_9EURO|nr:hypothetical protein ACJ72_07824 [Emergomyces africanus]